MVYETKPKQEFSHNPCDACPVGKTIGQESCPGRRLFRSVGQVFINLFHRFWHFLRD